MECAPQGFVVTASRTVVTLVAGRMLLEDSTLEAWISSEGGRVVDWGEGEPPGKPDATGWIVPAPVNAHTHVGDSFLRDVPGKPGSLAELVGPGGWKHRNLAHAQADLMRAGIQAQVANMASYGTSRFIDFREGGLGGVVFLRALAEDLEVQPIILGRPASNTFIEAEAQRLIQEADGIGLSARRDFARASDVESWAEVCHKARKPFALHASEGKREDIESLIALEPTFLVHCTQASPGNLRQLADAEIPVVVCPRSNAHFGMKTPLPAMLDAGCHVALGTDNGMLNDGNLLAELEQLQSWWPRVPTEQLLRIATSNGRRLAGLAPALPPKRGAALDLVVYPDPPLRAANKGKPGFLVGGPA
jgi:cytosine/adenosine deaminase-related metal-dependent hydrolase